jgi:hypothetical protein
MAAVPWLLPKQLCFIKMNWEVVCTRVGPFSPFCIHPNLMDFYVGFGWFTGQIVNIFCYQKKCWQTSVLAVTHMFCTVNQSRVNDCILSGFLSSEN